MSHYRLFDSFQDAVLVVTHDGSVIYGNQAASVLLEVSARRLCSGKSLDSFVNLATSFLGEGQDISAVVESTQVKEIGFTLPSGKAGQIQVSVQRQPASFDPPVDVSEDTITEVGFTARGRWIIYMRDVTLEKTLHDKYRAELDKKEVVIKDLQTAREKLEDYSHNLEKMVETRTAELKKANQLLKTILDSLGQAILVFDGNGLCSAISSQITKVMLGQDPAGKAIEDVLQMNGAEKKAFANWREAAFGEMLSFEEMVPLAPDRLKSSDEREISLAYNPMRDSENKVQGVVLVATDRTREVQALKAAAHEKAIVRRIVQIARNRESFRHFIVDARKLLASLIETAAPSSEGTVTGFGSSRIEQTNGGHSVLNRLHTLKGGASSFSLTEIAASAHRLEESLKNENLDLDPQSEAKFMLAQLERDLASISELLGPIETASPGDGLDVIEVSTTKLKAWTNALARATSVTDVRRMLDHIVVEIFERPVGGPLAQFDSSLQELATELGKKLAPLKIKGGESSVPIEYLRPFLNSLVHAFRNSLDHGIETPDERVQAGKTPEGHITVEFQIIENELSRELIVEIADDGRGINTDRVRAKLLEQGETNLAKLPEPEIFQVILRSELSTAETLTQTSGRGVGLSAVAEETSLLGGKIEVQSKRGKGTTLQIRIPLSRSKKQMQEAA